MSKQFDNLLIHYLLAQTFQQSNGVELEDFGGPI